MERIKFKELLLKKIIETVTFFISFYTLFIIVKIAIIWISPKRAADKNNFISKMCDPYLNLFKKLKFTQIGIVDISPLVAVMVLAVINQILTELLTREITIGTVLSLTLSSLWNIFKSFAFFVLLIGVIRYIIMMFTSNKSNSFNNICDDFFVPLSSKVASLFIRDSVSNYQKNMTIFIILTVTLLIAGSLAVKFITGYLAGF